MVKKEPEKRPRKKASSPAAKKKKKVLKKKVAKKSTGKKAIEADPELSEMFNKMKKMQNDLKGKMLELYEKSGLSKQEVDNFLDNPENYPKKTRDKLDRQLKELEQKMGRPTTKKKGAPLAKEKAGGKSAKKRKKKMIGARKKWMKM